MVSNVILIGITVGIFFAGIGVSYTIFSSTYDPNTMKFADQELFDQMMSNNPKMTAQWMESTMQDPQSNQQMMEQMNDMMNDPKLQQQMITMMKENQDFMQDMMKNMMDSSEMMSSSTMSGMQFNTDVPITIPMIDGYYNGEKVYFIHTEISDKDIADMMTSMVNFPTLHVPDLDEISPNDLGKVYIFTNGISGSGPYGGGPFFFQIDIFDSVPGMDEYNQFRVPQLVTWNENSNPTLLTSIEDLFEAEVNGELSIESTDFVVNAPMIVWTSDGTTQTVSMIQNMFESMPGVKGELTFVDENNYIAIFKLHSEKGMDMMGMSP